MSDEKVFRIRITPLGAAYVEALPNQQLAEAIRLLFDNCGICPSSKLFTQEEANRWAEEAFKTRRQILLNDSSNDNRE